MVSKIRLPELQPREEAAVTSSVVDVFYTPRKQTVSNVVGDIARTRKADQYNLTKSFTRAKYMKNKLQSFEVSYIMDSSPLKKEIKNNILKSMWLYAASEGFTVFNKNESTTFLLSSSYIKCAA